MYFKRKLITGLALALSLAPGLLEAKTFMSLEEGLKAAYPGCASAPETHYLTPAQLKQASKDAGTEVASAVVIRYVAKCEGGRIAGYAYTDTHRVRTHPETLLILVDTPGQISRVEVLSFEEPTEYLPKPEWYLKFGAQALGPELALKRAIPPVTGASLTSRSTTEACRRVLALHEIIGRR